MDWCWIDYWNVVFQLYYTLLTDQLFNFEFQFESVFNLEFQPKFGIQLEIPIWMGINLGECSTHQEDPSIMLVFLDPCNKVGNEAQQLHYISPTIPSCNQALTAHWYLWPRFLICEATKGQKSILKVSYGSTSKAKVLTNQLPQIPKSNPFKYVLLLTNGYKIKNSVVRWTTVYCFWQVFQLHTFTGVTHFQIAW